MLRLLIAEGSEPLRRALEAHLRGVYILRVCGEGNEALAHMRAFRPDIMILDLALPGLDGITLLHSAAREQKLPALLVTTTLLSGYIDSALNELHVSYVLRTPCPLMAIIGRLDDIALRLKCRGLHFPDMRTYIDTLLVRLGVPTNLNGYGYLRDAVAFEACSPGHRMMKELYPKVGRLYGDAGSGGVERSIRSAVERAWLTRDEKLWRMYFQLAPDGSLPKPTSSRFITALAADVRIHYDADGKHRQPWAEW